MRSPSPADVPEQYEFFPSQLDGKAISVTVNLWYRDRAPLAAYPHLGWIALRLSDPAEHGMGGPRTAEDLGPADDRLRDRLVATGRIHHVGRLRGLGQWKLVFYATDPDVFRSAAAEALADWPDLERDVGTRPDPGWDEFRTVLSPGPDAMQFISDRRVVEALQSHGDPLIEPRPVDHWLYFETAAGRDRFLERIQDRGFTVVDSRDDAPVPRPHSLHLQRTDFVDLRRIHEVVMDLVESAREAGGEYDGWETQIRRP